MKLKGQIFLMFFFSLWLISCGVSSEDAVLYNDTIIKEQLKVIKALDTLDNTFATEDSTKLLLLNNLALKQAEQSLEIIEQLSAFRNDDSFQKAGIDFFQEIIDVLQTSYPHLINLLYATYTEEIAQEAADLSLFIDDRINEAIEKLSEAQEAFAENHNFFLLPNDSITLNN